ncbi:hypothetical protein G5B38_11265 [Pseudohalocynthiibacter aestuariivivens]|nr:hypothetical protein [Pseudohalocynthiibacter aestuariivivens]QIE46053.1 hypothetical protein G5B38_11265 [Pseudohalocynthiibacter aestuariivivens]
MKPAWATLFFLSIVAVSAQTQTASADDGFCTAQAQDVLASLNGSWTLRQKAGVARAGGAPIPIPLPAHPPQQMEMDAWDNFGFSVLSGQGQSMVMLPAVSDAVAEHIDTTTDSGMETVHADVAGCDWAAMPTLVGTNTYSLQGPGGEALTVVDMEVAKAKFSDEYGVTVVVCPNRDTDSMFDDPISVGGLFGVKIIPRNDKEQCAPAMARVGSNEMEMTIFLRFDSANSAAGLLSFRGEMNGSAFSASAPLTMSR